MKTKLNKLNAASLSIAGDNIAWNVANKANWSIIGAAKMQHADNIQQVERPQYENILLVDGVRDSLTIAANVINGAELDGISFDSIDLELGKQMKDAFESDAKAIARIDNTNYRKSAIRKLATELGMSFLKLTKEEKQPLVAERCQHMRVNAHAVLENARIARSEYRDIVEYFARCITNAPDAANAITGNQDISDYLEVREKAVQTRLSSLKENSTMIDGEWKNRYDKNGNADMNVISELEGHYAMLLEGAIEVGIDVSKLEALPTEADISKVIAELETA